MPPTIVQPIAQPGGSSGAVFGATINAAAIAATTGGPIELVNLAVESGMDRLRSHGNQNPKSEMGRG